MSRIERKHEEIDATPRPAGSHRTTTTRACWRRCRNIWPRSKRGRRPNRQELLARHPEIADELSACLNGLTFVQSAAAQMPGSEASERRSRRRTWRRSVRQAAGRFQARSRDRSRRHGRGLRSGAAFPGPSRRGESAARWRRRWTRAISSVSNEAQAAAQLHHTNIVPVYAVGCERSVHFYAMQLIDGQSLADVIRDLRRIAGRERRERDSPANATATATPRDMAAAKRHRRRSTSMPMRSPAARRSRRRSTESLRPCIPTSVNPFSEPSRGSACRPPRLSNTPTPGRRPSRHQARQPDCSMSRDNLWITDFGLAQFYAVDSGLTQTGDLVGTSAT